MCVSVCRYDVPMEIANNKIGGNQKIALISGSASVHLFWQTCLRQLLRQYLKSGHGHILVTLYNKLQISQGDEASASRYGYVTFQLADACPQQSSAAVALKFKSRSLPWEISAEISGNGAHGKETGRKWHWLGNATNLLGRFISLCSEVQVLNEYSSRH